MTDSRTDSERAFAALSRRQFLALSAASAAAVAAGCATNPVTGRRQLMLVSETEEINLDRTWSPHQFSADYGASQDAGLNRYLDNLGKRLAGLGHRPHMPYNFRAINAVVVNGYTFPAGSVGIARGLLVEMENEAQLAAVLGHEIGHVCARHAGEAMSKGMLSQLLVVGIAALVAAEKEKYAGLAAGLGMVGANLLLSRYSRANEREADALGMEYMVKAGYHPRGLAGIMEVFLRLQKSTPNAIEVLFATHPMSQERYDTAMERIQSQYASAATLPEYRERYMDETARLRRIKGAILQMQKAEEFLAIKKPAQAEEQLQGALRQARDDYAGLLLMAKCKLVQKQVGEAARYAGQAHAAYPSEPQALHVRGMARIGERRFSDALADFSAYEERLPGNTNTIYFRGFCHEQMGSRKPAAEEYARYYQAEPNGEHAEYVVQRLTEWGYMAKPAGGTK